MSELVFEDTLKNSRAYHLLSNDFRLDLGHAYMLVSPDDDTVKEFFTLIATTIFCETKSACMHCNECGKVLHGNHPDVAIINAIGENIKVEAIKDLTEDTGIKSFSGTKVYYIHRADLMNTAAQNKLLKTLEEPPKGVVIFLGVSNESAMLDTIKSRTRTVYLDVFDNDTVKNAMLDLGVGEDTASLAADCSEGMLGKAYKIAKSPDYANLYTSALSLLKGLSRSTDVVALDHSPVLLKQTDEFLNVLSIVLRDMLAVKGNNPVLSRHVGLQIRTLAEGFSMKAISEIILLINQARRKLSLNVNVQATIDSLLFSILEAKYKWQ